MCMQLVVYSSRTRGFDGQIFVERTVNKLPQAKCLLVRDQSLDLASVDQGLQDVITRQVPAHELHALLANLKRLVREELSLTLPLGILAFHVAFGG
jgi:pentose-5-phosphate-3-epimerase